MTASNSVSVDLPIADISRFQMENDDIFAPPSNDNALPRPLSNTADSGRITFGAGYRLPTSK